MATEFRLSARGKLYMELRRRGLDCDLDTFSKLLTDYLTVYKAILEKRRIK